MKKILLCLLLVLPDYSVEAKVKYVDCLDLQIRRNNRFLSNSYRKEVTDAIRKVSLQFDVPANVIAAIAAVESSYRVNAVNKGSNDYGILQVNEYNIVHYGFDRHRLTSDVEYSVRAGVRVFRWFYTRYPLEEAIMRFNAGTGKGVIKWKVVKDYLRKVKKKM